MDVLADAGGFAAAVTEDLRGFLRGRRLVLDDVSPELAPLAEAVEDFVLGGGKRLRPAFCYWGWRGAGGDPESSGVLSAAAALELLQACCLIHDDIMDASDTRRGLPTMHRKFESWHAESRLRGTAASFGSSVATLMGDLCLAWCAQMFDGCGLPADSLTAARPVFHEMHTEVIAGQYLDLIGQSRDSTSYEQVRTIMRYKTAKYTVERPLHLGGLLAGAGENLLASYSAFALPLGEAFQLRDDVLGVFGDPAVTGKPAGDDLREGKRTALVAFAASLACDADARRLERCLGDCDLDDDDIVDLRSIIAGSGALGEVETLIERHFAVAMEALDAAEMDPRAHRALARLAITATRRGA